MANENYKDPQWAALVYELRDTQSNSPDYKWMNLVEELRNYTESKKSYSLSETEIAENRKLVEGALRDSGLEGELSDSEWENILRISKKE